MNRCKTPLQSIVEIGFVGEGMEVFVACANVSNDEGSIGEFKDGHQYIIDGRQRMKRHFLNR